MCDVNFFSFVQFEAASQTRTELALILGVHVLNPKVYKYSKLLTF